MEHQNHSTSPRKSTNCAISKYEVLDVVAKEESRLPIMR